MAEMCFLRIVTGYRKHKETEKLEVTDITIIIKRNQNKWLENM